MYPRPLPCLGNNQLQQRPTNNTLFPSRLCEEPSISSPWSSLSYWTSSSSRSPSSSSPPSSSYWTSTWSQSGGGVWHVQSTDGVRVWHCRGGQSLLFLLFSTTLLFFIFMSYSAFPHFLNIFSFFHTSLPLCFSSLSHQLFISSYFCQPFDRFPLFVLKTRYISHDYKTKD